ncbi:MAG: hypothetical protein HFI05_11645 [Lachnospiraceae bacterium]|jgi:hypothetical protein|nr:hypothetical protein [Lachnospiraceae bacterium]
MGESALSMNYEFNLLGMATNLQLIGGESFPMIDDEPVEKEVVEKNFFDRFIENIKPSGLLVSAIFGGIAIVAAVVAAPLTGIAAIVAGAVAIGAAVASVAVEIYTYGTALIDTITGHQTDDDVFLDNALTIGATTFVLTASFAAIPGLAAVGGGGSSLALAGGGTMALEGGLIISSELIIAGVLEVAVAGTLVGAIALAASMKGNGNGNKDTSKYVPKTGDWRSLGKKKGQWLKENGYEEVPRQQQGNNKGGAGKRVSDVYDSNGNKIGRIDKGFKVDGKTVPEHFHSNSDSTNIHYYFSD